MMGLKGIVWKKKSYEEIGGGESIVYLKFVKEGGSCCGSPRSVLKSGSWKEKENEEKEYE